jgi:membrane protease YdiL (CAAX protease family)
MLFLLKRRWQTALAGLILLAALGLGLRGLLPEAPPLDFSAEAVLLGAGVFATVLCSDVILHGVFCLAFGAPYRRRHRELAEVFRGQSLAAILIGALMAGVGEELVFRGLGSGPVYLIVSAVVFGGLHHIRASLWPFTPWAVYQGLLLAAPLYLTGMLAVTMVAHFLHDFTGFLLFRYLHGRAPQPAPA